MRQKMIFNDSMAIIFVLNDNNEPWQPYTDIIGDKLQHHGRFSNLITGESFEEVDWPVGDKFLIRDTTVWNWQLLPGIKKILHYSCRAAKYIDKNNDSVFVWYTNDLKFPKGSLDYNNVPGVVLEAFDNRQWKIHIKAKKIKEIKVHIVPPAEGQIVSISEFEARKSNQ